MTVLREAPRASILKAQRGPHMWGKSLITVDTQYQQEDPGTVKGITQEDQVLCTMQSSILTHSI